MEVVVAADFVDGSAWVLCLMTQSGQLDSEFVFIFVFIVDSLS